MPRILDRLVPALALAALTVLPAAESIVERIDPALLARTKNFGYSPEDVQRIFAGPRVIPLDTTHLNRAALKAPPAPGIHPRVLFNPEDLPDLRARLTTTKAGQTAMKAIRAHLSKQIGEGGSQRAVYDALVTAGPAGDLSAIDRKEVLTAGFITLYEAFRCLVDEDQASGARAGAAIAALARLSTETINDNIAKLKNPAEANDFRVVAKNATYQGTLGLMYDFAHGFMTPEQRTVTRAGISRGSKGMTFIGCETLRAGNANFSNWIPWSCRMIYLCAAIEGEEGYDPEAYRRVSDAMTGFIGGIYETGEAFEGWGKNFLFLEHLAVMAKRGKDVIAARNLQNVFRTYYLHTMNPWGRGFTFYDSQGGSDQYIERTADAVMYRHFFPGDRLGDFVYRNHLKDDYANVVPNNRVNTSHPFAVTDTLCSAIFAADWDETRTWKEAQAQSAAGQPLTLFSQDTNNLITRSAWTTDALWLNYLTRAVPGGHRYSDRSHFSVSALGRTWGTYHRLRQVREQFRPENRSVVLLDDEGPSIAPGRCVRFDDQPLATVVATDLRAAWEYLSLYVYPTAPKTETVTHLPFTPNHFRLTPSPLPWMDLPYGQQPDWLTSRKPGSDGQPQGNYDWARRPAMAFAYRTAVLVRGNHPYSLIVDDLKRDDQPRTATWGMTLAPDVTLVDTRSVGTGVEAVLGEAKPEAVPRHLLVRMVDMGTPAVETPAVLETIRQPNPPQKDREIPKLSIRSTGNQARFKALLVPYRAGEDLPVTTWSSDHTRLTIAWKDQVDDIAFTVAADGRSRVGIVRQGVTILPTDGR